MIRSFYTTIGQYPTLYIFLAIAPEEVSFCNYYPNICVKLKKLQPTLPLPPLYSWEMSHHMNDSGESLDVSVCHTVNMTSLSVCQLHDLSICQPNHDSTWNSVNPSVCL